MLENLHAAFHASAMVTEGAAEDGVKFVHSLLRWWLRPRLPLAHIQCSRTVEKTDC